MQTKFLSKNQDILKTDIIAQQIDTIVYEIYGLTQEEIKIIEGK